MAGSPSPAPNVPKLCLLPASHYDPNTSPPATALLPLLFPGALPGRFPFLVLTVVSQKPPWTQAVWASSLGRHARPQPCTSSPSAMHTSLHAHTHYQPLWTGIRLSSGNLEMSSARPLPMEGRTMPLPQFVLILTPRTYAWVLLLCKQGIGGCRWHEGWSPADLDGGGQTTLGSVLSACVQCTMGPSACKRAAGERTSGRRHNGAQPALQTREERPQAKGQGLQEL